jgi:hypothetical protein
MPRKREERPLPASKFNWKGSDIIWTVPIASNNPAPEGVDSDQHDLLWALDRVSNNAGFQEVLENVRLYDEEHPNDPVVKAKVAEIAERVRHAT